MNPDPFLPYARQSINPADIAAACEALAADIITRGPHVEAFEEAIAAYCGAKYGIAFNSGTTALAAACHAADVSAHDRLISTPNTFIASVLAGATRGATPVFIDIDRSTGNMDLALTGYNIEQKLSRGRHIILPVHFAGIAVDIERLNRMIVNENDIIIEDAAHALGSLYPDGVTKVGSCAWSDMTVFSFHPAKTITTCEGGMVMTNDPELAFRLKRFRNNGIVRDPARLQVQNPPPYDGYYEVMEMTGNYNFTEFQAALGLSQLQRIDQFISKRRQLTSTYRRLLRDLPHIRLLTDAYDDHTAFHLCVVQIDFAAYQTTRKHVVEKLKERNIGTQVHYIPVYHHPCVVKPQDDISPFFPEMEAYYSQALTLPLYYDLKEEDVQRVVETLQEVLRIPAPAMETKPSSRPRHHVRQKKR